MKMNEQEKSPTIPMRGVPARTAGEQIVTDPNGSYTGRPRDPHETPIQDADDL